MSNNSLVTPRVIVFASVALLLLTALFKSELAPPHQEEEVLWPLWGVLAVTAVVGLWATGDPKRVRWARVGLGLSLAALFLVLVTGGS